MQVKIKKLRENAIIPQGEVKWQQVMICMHV